MESVFEAFISNPALYSAGHLVGETLHFPTNTEEVQSLLKPDRRGRGALPGILYYLL